MRVNIDFPKAYYDKATTAKKKKKIMARYGKHVARAMKRK